MKLNLFVAGADVRDGMKADAFLTEREAEDWVLDEAGLDREALEAQTYRDFWEFVNDESEHMDTFNIEIVTIDLSGSEAGNLLTDCRDWFTSEGYVAGSLRSKSEMANWLVEYVGEAPADD